MGGSADASRAPNTAKTTPSSHTTVRVIRSVSSEVACDYRSLSTTADQSWFDQQHPIADVVVLAKIDFQRQLFAAIQRQLELPRLSIGAQVFFSEQVSTIEHHAAGHPPPLGARVIEGERGLESDELLVEREGKPRARVHRNRVARFLAFA